MTPSLRNVWNICVGVQWLQQSGVSVMSVMFWSIIMCNNLEHWLTPSLSSVQWADTKNIWLFSQKLFQSLFWSSFPSCTANYCDHEVKIYYLNPTNLATMLLAESVVSWWHGLLILCYNHNHIHNLIVQHSLVCHCEHLYLLNISIVLVQPAFPFLHWKSFSGTNKVDKVRQISWW